MKKARIILIFTVLSFSSCVTYYNSSDVNKYFDSGVSQADKAVNDAEKDFVEKTGIIAGIRENVADPGMLPYPAFDGQLAAMGTAPRCHEGTGCGPEGVTGTGKGDPERKKKRSSPMEPGTEK